MDPVIYFPEDSFINTMNAFIMRLLCIMNPIYFTILRNETTYEDVSTNLSYKSKYSKSIFVNKCLLDSCESFIDIMLDSSKKIG